MDRKKAERINQELQKNLCQTFQTEAAIDLACDQDQVLREHFPHKLPEVTEKRYFLLIWKKFTNRDIWFKRKDKDDETETARPLSERDKRELFRQHRNLGHPQPTELARALRHAGARREAIRFVLKELRCPTCEARPLPASTPVQECCHAVYVLTNALALTWVTWKSEMEPLLKH